MWAATTITLGGAIYLLIRTPRQPGCAGSSSSPNEPSALDAPSCLTPTSITSTVETDLDPYSTPD
jgi:hypothetical protein